MPAGLFDEADTGMPDLPQGPQGMPQGIAGGGLMGGAMMGGALGGAGQQPYSEEEMRTALAQILAKNAPQGQGQPSPEDVWAMQGQQQGLSPPPPLPNPTAAGPNAGMNLPTAPPMNQALTAPMPNLAPPQGGGMGGAPAAGIGDPSKIFPGAQSFNLGAQGQGAFQLPPSIRYGRK